MSDAEGQKMDSKTYRCYFTDGDDRIRTFEQIECADDAAAALEVELLLGSSRYSSAELWQGKRLVAKWANGTAKDGTAKSEARQHPEM
jgi:hypothetical protein